MSAKAPRKEPKSAEATTATGSSSVIPAVRSDPALLLRARSVPLTRDGVGSLASLDEPTLSATLHAALDARDIKAATALALAVAAAGGSLDPELVERLIPDIDQRDLVPSLLRAARAHSTEQRLALMQQAIERGQLSHDREAIVAFIASRQLGEPPWPAPWPGLMRALARQQLGTEAGVLMGVMIERSKDEHLALVGEEWIDLAKRSNADEVAQFWIDGWDKPVLEILPDVEAPRVVAGYTVRKSQERPGRNDPCHCGSGKKYKKCCAAKDDAADRLNETPLVDVAKVTATDVEGMRIQEVLALPFEKLQRPALLAVSRQLRAYHRWEDAERALDVLETMSGRGSSPPPAERPANDSERGSQPPASAADQVEDYRQMLIEEALRMRILDVVERQLAKMRDPDALKARVRAGIACARPTADTLNVLDDQARRGLRGDIDATLDVAYSLLDHAPALGILVSRGALDPAREHDSDTLLEEIEYARDRLELPPGDPFGPLYDTWVEGHKAAERQAEATQAELARMRADLERAEQDRHARQAQVVELERELREIRERLEQKAQRDSAPGQPDSSELAAAYRNAEEHRQRLARKVDELKALLAEGNAERAALRDRVHELEAAEREAAERDEHDDGDELEGESVAFDEDTMPVRIPVFSRKSLDALSELPPKVMRTAVASAGRLGAGDRAAWRDVKRMQGMEGVWTARLGIHHRLIFTVSEDELSVMDIVTREALLTSLERYR